MAYKGLADFFTNFEGLYQGGPITALEQAFNENMNSVRSRAEHAVAEHVEGKQMFHGTYRGKPKLLENCHHLIAHTNRVARRITGLKYAPSHHGPHPAIY